MKIVAGLGNPGAQYASTPHSVGFEAADAIAATCGAAWEEKRRFKCLWAEARIGAERVVLVKPLTFMNLSGESVAQVLRYSNCGISDLIVVHDDIDLPLGRLRVRLGGSCGGHNGVRNIIERAGSDAFVRVKIGVGKDASNVIGYVLGKFSPEARKVADRAVEAAAKAVVKVVTDGPSAAMNEFNALDVSRE